MQRFAFILSVLAFVGLLVSCGNEQKMSQLKDVTALAMEYFELLKKGEYTKAVKNYDSTMTESLPPEKLEEIWKLFLSQAGALKRQMGIRTEKVEQYDIVYISCKYERLDIDIKIVFNSKKQIAGMFFIQSENTLTEYEPPSYVNFDSFEEKEVKIGNGEWELPGTLTIPLGEGDFPAVVLVHGSGTHDRDETVGPNKPFRNLAQGLASLGIAVLRYDKRTQVYGAKISSNVDNITVREETIDDALSAVTSLRKEKNIDADKIFVLGHSLGGMLIPRIGALDSKIAGFIILAGSARPLEDIIFEQMSYLFSIADSLFADDDEQLEQIKEQIARVKDQNLSLNTPSTDLPLGIPAGYWLDLHGYNPPEMARELKRPILVLQGERDYQVTMEDFRLWKKSLSSIKNVEFISYPNLNHLFIEGEGRSTPVEYQTPGYVAQIVINDIADWIGRRIL